MFEAVQEIAIYIHRFHNLDLFQQGWYQIKITVKWENSEYDSVGVPARVVQYEAADMHGIWRIDDTDSSFSTQPFRIRYARQDVSLSTMISFNLSLDGDEGRPASAVIMKFELMYAPLSGNGFKSYADIEKPAKGTYQGENLTVFSIWPMDASSAAFHEFRIPTKALIGLHSYCPISFDAMHSVLVDTTVHISLLKASAPLSKLSCYRDNLAVDDVSGGHYVGLTNALLQVASVRINEVMLVKKLLTSRDVLIEDLQRLGKAIDQDIDLTDFISNMDDLNFDSVWQSNLVNSGVEVPGEGKPRSGAERKHGPVDFRSNSLLRTLSRNDLLKTVHSLGDQLMYLWNIFLSFHRANRMKILEFLRYSWSKDRKAEWSIWMVHSKVEMPHHYISSSNEKASHQGRHKRASTMWKLPDDPALTAAMRAELHRRSIAQMKINSRSIQDMHIFGDPSHLPIVIVERIMNAPCRAVSAKSFFSPVDLNLHGSPSSEATNHFSGARQQQKGRVLKIVVFVHGFQGHHLDLRLIRNQWLLIDPRIDVLMSEANEEDTSGDFREMGQRLAEEVISFVKKKIDKNSRYGQLEDIKLSFVGHSIGNVIVRAAIAESIMEPFLKYLYTYVSISGPHLGYLYSSNSLFNSGLWLLKKLKNSQCIHQLTFTDARDIRDTFFFGLCKEKTLEQFKNIILFSSPQDGYIPYHSARIELCQAASLDFSRKGKIFLEMLNNCLDQLRSATSENRVFLRCDVNFDTSAYGKSLNTYIGRAAHIEFLESDSYARFIMWSFPELFL